MIPEIRFYTGTPTAEGVCFRREKWDTHNEIGERVECNDGKNVEATWCYPGPVKFSRRVRKCMLPFACKVYQTLDELAADILEAGLRLVDMRKAIGVVRDMDHFYELFETHTLERFRSEVIFIRRATDGSHGDIWQLSQRAFEAIDMHRLVKVGKNTARQTYILPRRTFYDLGDWGQKSVSDSFKMKSNQSVIGSPSPICIISDFPTPASIPPERKPKKNRPQDSPIFAYDDDGKPITEHEITLESTRTMPRSMPPNLIPEAPADCSDEQWEKLMLAEQVKFRRRSSAKFRAL